MASEVEICNLALSHINAGYINSLSGTDKASKECNRLYPVLRNAVLADYPWGFATKYQTLAQVTAAPSGSWNYAYALPSDCLAVRRIYNPADENVAIPFEPGISADLTVRIIHTNMEPAVLVYTAAITVAEIFTAAFVDALSYRIAADLAIPLKGDANLQQAVMRSYLILRGQAQQRDSREEVKAPDNRSDFSRAR